MRHRCAPIVCWLLLTSHLGGAELPSEVLDLSLWKLTLPVDTQRPGSPDEIRQPELKAFRDATCFDLDANGRDVVFRAPCGGATTRGSQYPRCELREMASSDGKTAAHWSTSDGRIHTLTAQLAVRHTPKVKKQVVCAQIHDREDDLLMIRLEGQKLIVERNDSGDVLLDPHYEQGRFFDLKVEAAAGHVRVWYDGALKLDWEVSREGCYFKAGCYTQSNLKRGDQADAYGEVAIRSLQLRHMAGN